MWSEILWIGGALVAGFVIGVPFGVVIKSWLLSKAEVAQAKFDAAVAKAVADLKKTGV